MRVGRARKRAQIDYPAGACRDLAMWPSVLKRSAGSVCRRGGRGEAS